MKIVYRIKDWNMHFENNKSRERERCSFCCIPNKQDGLGYGQLIREENGEALYGAFVAITLVASKQKSRDGWLTADGLPTGCPLTARQLSIKSQFSESTVQRMLDACAGEEIGWIEKIEVKPCANPNETQLKQGDNPQVPAECPPGALEEKRREGNRIEPPLSPPVGDGEKKLIEVPKKGPIQLRAEALMRRPSEKPFTDKERKAFQKNKDAIGATTEAEWKALETFYAAPQEFTFARKDLSTLLNNWNGEIDRAKIWAANPLTNRAELRKELERATRERQMLGRLQDYDAGQAGYKRIKELDARLAELRKELGVTA